MRIGIIGPQKVGKTTLFDEVIKELPAKFVAIKELALSKDILITESNGFFDYMRLQEVILNEDLKYQKHEESLEEEKFTIYDRTLIDNFAYMVSGVYSPYDYAFPGDIDENIELLGILSPIVVEAIDRFKKYDLIFYVPIEFRFGDPTVEQIMYQERIDDVIRHLLIRYEIDYHTVRGSVRDRVQFILKTFQKGATQWGK